MGILHATQSFADWFFGPGVITRRPDPLPEARPTAEFGYNPRATEDAFWTGWNLGLEREDAAAPSEFNASLRRSFDAGYAAGRREWDRRLEEMCGAAEYAEWSESLGGPISDRDMYPHGGVS